MRVGVTGWNGFIGGHLLKRLNNPILFEGGSGFMEDIVKFVNGCDRIYHLAGLNRAHFGGILVNNLSFTGRLVLAVKQLTPQPEVIFISSTHAEWNANSEYGLTKGIEEELIKRVDKWCIFRVPNVYGEACKPFYNSVVATFAYQIVRGETPTINDPRETREFIYVGDLIDVLLKPTLGKVIHPEGETMSIGEIYELLTSRLGEHNKLQRCLEYYKEANNVPSTH